MHCLACGTEFVPPALRCEACGARLDVEAEELERHAALDLDQALWWLSALGLLYVAAGVYLFVLGRPSGSAVMAAQFGVAALHLALWRWARDAPLGAAVGALGVFAAMQVVDALFDPLGVTRGWQVKLAFVYAIVRVLRAGVAVRRHRVETEARGRG